MSCKFFGCARFQISTFVWLLYLEKVSERGFLTPLSHAPWSSRTNQYGKMELQENDISNTKLFSANNFLSRFARGLLCFNLSFTGWVLHRKSEYLRMYKWQLVTTTWVLCTRNWATSRMLRIIKNLLWVLHRKSEDLRMYKRQLVTITWVVHEQLGYFEKAKKYHELALNITQKKLGRR